MQVYRYTESGLDNVIIEGVTFAQDDAEESCVDIPHIRKLHRAIAQAITVKRTSVTGKELRFLRTEMGMTQAELAGHVHREPLAVSRWERGEVDIDPNAEALIRLHAIEVLGLEEKPSVSEVSGWCVASAETPPIVIDGSEPGHYRVKSERMAA